MAEGLSKKQLRELKKLEKTQARNLEQKNSTVKWVAIAIVSAIFLALFVGVVLVAKNKNNPQTADGTVTIAEDGYVRMAGNVGDGTATESAEEETAKVTLVEYADFQCPACKSYHPLVVDILGAYPDQLRLIFKHFPLISIHPNAMDAALAAEAAGRQGKFFEYADQLYLVQSEWASLPNPQEKFEEYATTLGLDLEQFRSDIKDPALKEVVENHRSEGITNGVSGTPTFFVNGQRIDSPSSLEEFRQIIDAALGAQGQVAPDDASASEEETGSDTSQQQLQLLE